PEAGTLPAPAHGDLPQVAMPLPAPALPEASRTLPAPATSVDVLPETAHTMAAQQTGFRGLWAKLTGLLTGKPMHIEG
ncbi:MAG: hypothetical protein ACRDQB_18105, partial [Thermocrispum sp.]